MREPQRRATSGWLKPAPAEVERKQKSHQTKQCKQKGKHGEGANREPEDLPAENGETKD